MTDDQTHTADACFICGKPRHADSEWCDDHTDSSEPAALVVTDCCGRLLPKPQTLRGDVHYPDLCPACDYLDGREHDSHVTCTDGECPGRDWTYVDGEVGQS